MLEVTFSDSVAGALLRAMGGTGGVHMYVEVRADGTAASTPCELPPYTGPLLDGEPENLLPLWLMADVGDISPPDWWTGRAALLRQLDAYHAGTYGEELEPGWVEQEAARLSEGVERLLAAARGGEPVRLWWDETPGQLCGFYWAMSLLRDAPGPVYSVHPGPLYPPPDGPQMLAPHCLGELPPEAFSVLAARAQQVGPEARRELAAAWETLAAQNAPLRAVVNGRPVSVGEDFYDPFLLRAAPERETPMLNVLGRALGVGPPGVSDWWYGRRLHALLENGTLEYTRQAPLFSRCMIQRTKESPKKGT